MASFPTLAVKMPYLPKLSRNAKKHRHPFGQRTVGLLWNHRRAAVACRWRGIPRGCGISLIREETAPSDMCRSLPESQPFGPDGPEAWAKAEALNAQWDKLRGSIKPQPRLRTSPWLLVSIQPDRSARPCSAIA